MKTRLSTSQPHSRPVVLMTLGGGGHQFQAMALAKGLEGQCDIRFVTSRGSQVPKVLLESGRHVFRIQDVSTVSGSNTRLLQGWNTFLAALQALRILLKVRPDMVVGVGSALSVPLFLAARLLNRKTVFVESVTRVTTPTQTGQILSRLRLASAIYVQWPEGTGMYPGARHTGRVA